MTTTTKSAKPLSAAALKRAVATQDAWAVVDRTTGAVCAVRKSRADARRARTFLNLSLVAVIVRVDLRVRGERA